MVLVLSAWLPRQKPTKAQKRREQRAADEAEREARIAGEQAGLGESERQQEADALRDLLRPLGLAVRDVPVSDPIGLRI